MPRPRFYRLPPERQAEILDAAAEAFAAHGYEGASYNHILEAVGLSKGSAYYTFEGKADLYAEVLRREMAAVIEDLPPPTTPADALAFWDLLRGWIATSLTFVEDHPRFFALTRGYMLARETGAVPMLDREFEGMAAGWVEGAIAAGQGVGAVRTDLDAPLLSGLASAVLAALDGRFLKEPLPKGEPGRAALVELYVDTLKRLLAPAPSQPAENA